MKNIKGLEAVIKAQPQDIAEYLDKIATYKGKYSWLIVPKTSKNRVCLVAHIDTVFEDKNITKTVIKEDGIWYSPQGICGDDRCGVYAIFDIYRNLPAESRPMLLLTDGEERGGYGAREATKIFKEQLENVTFFVELDRRGREDMVFYNNEPKEFINHIGQYGFVETWGSFSDITILGKAFKKCAVNVSVGYHDEHTLNETINLGELNETIEKIKILCISETGKEKVWENDKIYLTRIFD